MEGEAAAGMLMIVRWAANEVYTTQLSGNHERLTVLEADVEDSGLHELHVSIGKEFTR